MHCFLKMLSIFTTPFRLHSNCRFHRTTKHPQKSNPIRKSVKFQCRMKNFFIVFFGFFIRLSKFYTLSENDHLPNQNPILQIKSDDTRTISLDIQNKKKTAKISSRFTKKKVQATRLLIKSSVLLIHLSFLYLKNIIFVFHKNYIIFEK